MKKGLENSTMETGQGTGKQRSGEQSNVPGKQRDREQRTVFGRPRSVEQGDLRWQE